MAFARNLALWVDRPYDQDAVFKMPNPADPDGRLAPFCRLKSFIEGAGGWCHTQDVCRSRGLLPDAVLFLDMPPIPVNRILEGWSGKVKKYLLIQECDVVIPRNWEKRGHEQFDAVFTWAPELVDNVKYFKVNFSNALKVDIPGILAAREKFCVMISANKKKVHPLELYSERERTIRWFEANCPGDFDLYGIGWDRRVFAGSRFVRALNRLPVLPRLLAPHFPSYRGTLSEKRPLLSNYKFSICYENARDIPGYITEKIFDCFLTGCIPVYWGAPDVARYIPPECFIDRRNFKTHEDLYDFMRRMPDEEMSKKRHAMVEYLSGKGPYQFTDTYFAETIAGRLLNG